MSNHERRLTTTVPRRGCDQCIVILLFSETELHIEIHFSWTHESRIFCKVQSKWRMAC